MKKREISFFSTITGLHSIIYILLLGTIIVQIARTMSTPFLAIYLTKHTGLGPATIGGIIALGPLAGTIGGFIGGMLSDRIGLRKVIFISLLGLSLTFVGYTFITNPFLLMLITSINGLCGSFFEPVSKVLMADLTEESKRLRVFSLRYMANNIGFAIGPMVGALAGLSGKAGMFLVTALVYFLYLVILEILMAHFKVPDAVKVAGQALTLKSNLRIIVQDRALLYFIIGGVLSLTVHGQMSVTLSLHLERTFADGILLFSTLLTTNAIVVIFTQMPLSHWVENRTPFTGIALGCMLFAVGEVGFAFSTNWFLYILSMVIFTVGEVFVIPSEMVMMDRITPEGMRGTYYGAQTFTKCGNFLGPWIGGIVLGAYGGSVMFLMFGVISLLSIFLYWRGQVVFQHHTREMQARSLHLS